MLATARLLETDLIVYWQYQLSGRWVRDKWCQENGGRNGASLLQTMQGGEAVMRISIEPLRNFPETT